MQRTRRRLSAIFSADVAGYSRLMAGDEIATVDTLTRYRDIMSDNIQKFHGRVVDSPGDNLLAEFWNTPDMEATEILPEVEAAVTEVLQRIADEEGYTSQ